jgi:glycosyltransferase involved in cell wall biosynthesis
MQPRITIVTPSFNQGLFIEATIDSVLSQGYPDLEYIILDACSTDNTPEILRKYEQHITKLIIEPDQGSADAINKGLRMASGTWFNWLNSDDILLPGALHQLADHSRASPDANWITGAKLNLDANGRCVSAQTPFLENIAFWIFGDALFPQDATFIKRKFLLENQISLDTSLKNVYDTVLYLQLLAIERPLLVSSVFSAMRWHGNQKTMDTHQAGIETIQITRFKDKLPHAKQARLAKRLCSTRLRWVINPLIIYLASLNLWPSRLGWAVQNYNLYTQQFELSTIKNLIER